MNTDFDYFVRNDLSISNLHGVRNIYLLIGTYPTLLDTSLYTSAYAPILKSLLFKLAFQKINVLLNKVRIDVHSYNLNNSILYFIDQNYDPTYFKLVNEFLMSVFKPGLFECAIDSNRMSIIFSEINCKVYLLSLTIPTVYNFNYPSLPNLEKNIKEQLTYSIKCNKLSETWGLFLHNISIFLTTNVSNNIYILNDAIMFGRHILPNIIDNKNFEFFCELGYILNLLYLQQMGDNIYVFIPNDRIGSDQYQSVPDFNSLNTVYEFNFGIPLINSDGTKLNSEAQNQLAEKGLDGRTVDYEYDDYEIVNYTLLEYVKKNYPKLSDVSLKNLRNNL